jgi:hypothetical protein
MISNNETKQDAVSKALTKQFKGFNIRIRPSDGYIHATDMCDVGGKEWSGYIRNNRTKEFITELESVLQIRRALLIQSRGTGPYETRGTWIHPHIAINLAQWVNAIFAVKVAGWVGRFLAGDLTLAHDLVLNANQNGTINNVSIATNPKTKEIVAIAKTYTDGCLEAQVEFEILKDRYDEMNGTLKKKDVEISDLKKLLIEGDKKADDERKKADDERKKADDEIK